MAMTSHSAHKGNLLFSEMNCELLMCDTDDTRNVPCKALVAADSKSAGSLSQSRQSQGAVGRAAPRKVAGTS